jgi:3-carboxy-cis,cis-muconate cycloisomerase
MSQLYASLFYQPDVTEIFSDRALLSYMIQAEVALAKAQAQLNVIPTSTATIIEQVGQNALAEIDFDGLAVATGLAGNIAIPFVKQFTAIVKQQNEDALDMYIGVQPVKISLIRQ